MSTSRWAVLCLSTLTAFMIGSLNATSDDWPQWLGPQRDGVWRETGIVDKFPEDGLKVRWRTPIAAGYSGPAVADGKVFITDRVLAPGVKDPNYQFARGKEVPSSERIHCINEADGKILWTHTYDCPYVIAYPLGPRTTPAVKDGKVYTLGAEGNLFCLDIATGKVVWSHELKKEYRATPPVWGYASHLLVDGNKVFSLVGGDGTAVVAFDKDTGKEIWRALTCKDIGYSPPMIYDIAGKRQLIIWHGQAVNGLDPETGKLYWTYPVATYSAMSIATPRTNGTDLFLSAYSNVALMLRMGEKPEPDVLWKKPRQQESMHSCFSTPLIEGGHIYGCSLNGQLVCLNAETGERVWETYAPLNNVKNLASADTFLIKNGDKCFLFTENGDLIIAKLTPQRYDEISRTHLLDPTSKAWNRPVLWSHPAFANRCIYLRNDKELICVSLAK